MSTLVKIRELVGWGFDHYEYRPATPDSTTLSRAAKTITQRQSFEQSNVVLPSDNGRLREIFASYAERVDLLSEMSGLSWKLGIVDLRSLIAFQRRLTFTPQMPQPSTPGADDWPALLALSFPPPKPTEYEVIQDRATNSAVLQSSNPNLHLRLSSDTAHPITVHGGGPFFEVARFRNRWFLRDGYHRAYALLAAQVFRVPAVIVEAATIEELGATQPWFYPEEILFSKSPPRVIDFLNEDLVLEYDRPALIKTIHITISETLNPAPTGEHP